jgi:anti-sigma regulatory factor (Ser/Thr protein kinase)
VSISYEATFPPTPEGVGAMRREIAAYAQRAGLDEDGVADVRLAVSEAATNAVVHGYRDSSEGELKVLAYVAERELVVIVSDAGVGLAPRPDSPGLGLGMPLMASVTSRFRVVSRGPGTEIHMAFALPNGAAPA